jgi:uncharacterized protein Yka (UPF0111/DUF47 family)
MKEWTTMLNIAKLLPNEGKFLRYLEELAAKAQESAVHLKTYVESTDAEAKTKAGAAMTACKAEAKRVSAEVTRELCLTFVTPFDREDIQDFSADLYKITKTIEKLHEYLDMHKVTDIGDLSPQIDLIIEEADAMDKMIRALISGGKPRQIIEQAALLDELEGKGDAILGSLLVRLIDNAQDTRRLILRKDIYDMLERIIDRYRDAAGVALQIVLKHS